MINLAKLALLLGLAFAGQQCIKSKAEAKELSSVDADVAVPTNIHGAY